jgi:hypothetical protein
VLSAANATGETSERQARASSARRRKVMRKTSDR